jgi:hypothetical protein
LFVEKRILDYDGCATMNGKKFVQVAVRQRQAHCHLWPCHKFFWYTGLSLDNLGRIGNWLRWHMDYHHQKIILNWKCWTQPFLSILIVLYTLYLSILIVLNTPCICQFRECLIHHASASTDSVEYPVSVHIDIDGHTIYLSICWQCWRHIVCICPYW